MSSYEKRLRRYQQSRASGMAKAVEQLSQRSPGRAGIFNLSGYTSNRDLFTQLREGNIKKETERSHVTSALAAASGGTGSKAAMTHQGRLQGSLKVEPPKPPREPTKPIAPIAYKDPRRNITLEHPKPHYGPSEDTNRAYVVWHNMATRGVSSNNRAYATQYLNRVMGGAPLLDPADYDKLKQQGASKFAKDSATHQKNYVLYEKDYATWEGITKTYEQESADAKAYNKQFAADQAASTAGSEVATSKAAAAGKQGIGGGGAGEGIGSGVGSTSPGLSFIKRPDTVWI